MYQERFGNNIYQHKNDVAMGSTVDFYCAFRKNTHARTSVNNKSNNDTNMNNVFDKNVHTSELSYKCDHGINLTKSIKTLTKKALPEMHDARNISTGTKISFHFNIKDDTNKQRKHDLVYLSR